MDNKYTVYIHRNIINNKCYVGITGQKVNERWRKGEGYLTKGRTGNYCQPKFAKAIRKYGWENFEHIIWAEHLSHDDACRAERLLIAIWDTVKNGYNISNGGEGTTGVSRFGETNPFYGKHHSDKTKAMISKANKGNQYWLGKKHTDQTKELLRGPKSYEHRMSLSKNHADVSGVRNPRARKVIRLSDGRVFDYLKGAAQELGIHKETLRRYCKGHNGWMYLDEYDLLRSSI